MDVLAKKVAIVTGASSGIGRATARLFAGEGARVVVSGRRSAELDALVSDIEAEGGQAIAVPGDIKHEQVAKALVDTAVDRFGGRAVAVVGSIQLTDKYGTSLMINIPEKVKVTPAKAEKVLLERITLDRKGALVEATGEIVIARRSGDDIFLTIGDATGLVEVPLFGRTIRYAKNKERFSTVGREITVIGTIGEYRGRPQITIRDVEEIVTLAEDTIPTDKIPGREEAVKKAAELESK